MGIDKQTAIHRLDDCKTVVMGGQFVNINTIYFDGLQRHIKLIEYIIDTNGRRNHDQENIA
jgi:hypothetical protein